MNNKNNLKIYLFILSILALITVFFLVTNNSTQNTKTQIPSSGITTKVAEKVNIPSISTIQEEELPEETNKQILADETRIFSLETHYKNCSHTKTTTTEISENITLEDLKNVYKNAEHKTTIGNKIIFTKTEDGKCNEHYIIKEKDEKVAIYLDTPIKNVSLKEITDIPYSNISNSYKKEIEKGLTIDSNHELDLTLKAIRNSSLISKIH